MFLYIIMDIICLQGIDGSRTRVVFIQIAKCADRRARTMWHAGSEYVVFFLNALTVVFILVFWSRSSQ